MQKDTYMKRLIFAIAFLLGFLVPKINGQTFHEYSNICGNWYACGIRSIQINDTVTFYKSDSICKEKDCLVFKWVMTEKNKFRSGMQQGCGDTKIGYDLRKIYKCTFDTQIGLLSIKKRNSLEVYKVLELTDNEVIVFRQK
jgi:hypothetical protein